MRWSLAAYALQISSVSWAVIWNEQFKILKRLRQIESNVFEEAIAIVYGTNAYARLIGTHFSSMVSNNICGGKSTGAVGLHLTQFQALPFLLHAAIPCD